MTRGEMKRQVQAELNRILPRGPRGSSANTERMVFANLRCHHLARYHNTPVAVTLAEMHRLVGKLS